MSTPDFLAMCQDQCVAWYVENVGYDPVKDDPTLTLDQLRRDCAEMFSYASCTVDALGRGPGDADFDPCCGVHVYGGTTVRGEEPGEREQEAEDNAPVRLRMRM